MCVIIERKAGVEIPFQKLESACIVNPDGYGIIFLDRGQMSIKRGFNPQGNNAETIAKILEDAKDIDVVMHLRFMTVGNKGVSNTHPYPVLNMKEHGLDVQFMHNGTISGSEFRDAKGEFSDSYHFAKKVLTPLYERSLAMMDAEELAKDPVTEMILQQFAGSTNVFTITDNEGHVRIINKQRGKEFDGWWASNDYSFNRGHRDSSFRSDSGYYYQGGSSTHSSTSNTKGNGNTTYLEQWKAENANKPTSKKDDKLADETDRLKKTLSVISEADAKAPARIVAPEFRKTFCEMTGMDNLSLTTCFEQDDVYELVSCYPEAATILMMDLIHELYVRKQSEEVTKHVH